MEHIKILKIMIIVIIIIGIICIGLRYNIENKEEGECKDGCIDLGLELYNYDNKRYDSDCFCKGMDGLPVQIS